MVFIVRVNFVNLLMKNLLISCIVITFLLSCNKENSNFKIKGTIKGTIPESIYLSELSDKGVIPVDSAKINDKGEFTLKGRTDIPAFYLLKVKNSRGIHLIINSYDKIKIFINSENFDLDYVIEGSSESKRVSKLIAEQNKALLKITELSNKFESVRNKPDFLKERAKIDSVYSVIIKEHKKFSTDYILENTCSFAGLLALYQQLGAREPVFDIVADFKLFERVDSCLTSLYPSSDAVKNLNKKVVETREYLKIAQGATAPEIALTDTTGRTVSLHSLKAKYVLLNFWASWCTECRKDNAFMQQMYKKYKDKGFEIYQVSLDKTTESWKQGVKEDKIPWINVSDLKYWNSEAVKTYYIKEIPLFMLINPDGKIIEKEKSLIKLDVKLDELL